ncbi:MAG: glycine cleavage system aminomethyltransferase GcvT [Alphaproteobacteria bacterium]|nr:glycine cleavage system aminomethyltransferase GcvT [Alphaproteobacteria bacterium]
MSDLPAGTVLKTTPLTEAHVALGAKMVEFAGYDMPVQYPDGVLKEHLWTRDEAGVFDVSHMGPSFLTLNNRSGDPDADHKAVAALVEPLICGDIGGLKRGQLRYTLLLNDDGGILDDLMIGRPAEADAQGSLQIVVNAGTKDADFARIEQAVAGEARLERADENALIAVQGPKAVDVVGRLMPEARELVFMTFRRIGWQGHDLSVSRSGYTGEDGYEILVPRPVAASFWNTLLADERARPIGLGARDSLRLEAGLPLYGHDLDTSVSPVEADLGFALSKRRREAGDIPGWTRIAREMTHGPSRVRVGLKVLEGAPAREGAEVADEAGTVIGRVTSGGFSPSLRQPIALAFVPPIHSQAGTKLKVLVRGKAQAAEVVPTPFVAHRYVRKL